MRARRSQYDVSDRIDVTDPGAVIAEVYQLFTATYPGEDPSVLGRAAVDLSRLFNGEYPGYEPCDTYYHDLQHTLDATLATARLLYGHEHREPSARRMGPDRFRLGIVIALFHDAGYIRRTALDAVRNGAEYTRIHVSRSADFLSHYLPIVGLGESLAIARRLVHFTGYEMDLDRIELPDTGLRRLGEIIGTGDLIAQLADRCYLEKCRDRLYPEFVLGGLAGQSTSEQTGRPTYNSREDLLRQTPAFFQHFVRKRLDVTFARAYEYAAECFGGSNLYLAAIEQNMEYLRDLIARDRLDLLRRQPPRLRLVGKPAASPYPVPALRYS